MKNAKLIIILLVGVIILLVGFITGKGYFIQSPEQKAQAEYEKGRQERANQSHESSARIKEAFKNLDKLR